MGSFFQLNAELIHEDEGIIKSDILDVYLDYELDQNQQIETLFLNWKGSRMKLKS